MELLPIHLIGDVLKFFRAFDFWNPKSKLWIEEYYRPNPTSYNIIWALKWGKLHASTIMGIINVIVAAQKLLQFSRTTNKSSFTVMRKTLNATLQNDFFVRYLQFSDFNFVRIIQMTSYLQFCILADILKVGNTGAECHMQDILIFRKWLGWFAKIIRKLLIILHYHTL